MSRMLGPRMIAVLALSVAVSSGSVQAEASGATWTFVAPLNLGTFTTLSGVSSSASTDGWAVGNYEDGASHTFTLAEHWNGTAWSVAKTPNPSTTSIFTSVVDLSPTSAWAAGYWIDVGGNYQALFEHWNGKTWKLVRGAPDPTGFQDQIYGIAAASPTALWAVGDHYSGSIGGFDGLIEQWNGKPWKQVGDVTTDLGLTSVSARSTTDVWAVGQLRPAESPHFLHWNGSAWTEYSDPSVQSSYVTSVTAISANDVWAVGYWAPAQNAPYITLSEHWNGTNWSFVNSPNPAPGTVNLFLGVSAVASNDVWAVGYDYQDTASPVLENWDGTQWNIEPAPFPGGTTDHRLFAVSALPSGAILATGRTGYNPASIVSDNG